MPKSAAERVKAYLTRSRQHARETSRCYTCRKERPRPGRSICASCNAAALERQKRKRVRDREARKVAGALSAHERAGDVAREHHFHDGAAQHYRDALQCALGAKDRIRITEKLARVLFYENPQEASRWLDRALSYYKNEPEQSIGLAHALLDRSRFLWSDGRLEEAVPDVTRVIEIATAANDANLCRRATIRIVGLLADLGRFEEARSYFAAFGEVTESDDPTSRVLQYSQTAMNAAALGRLAEAYAYFDRAVRLAKEHEEAYLVVGILNNYGRWAKALGDMPTAKAQLERALLEGRRSQMTWFIPYLCLEYADILMRMGHQTIAHHYLLETLRHKNLPRIVEFNCAEVGLPLALAMSDAAALQKCSEPRIITHVMRSSAPSIIAPVCAAFARFYASQGKSQQAQNLLHRTFKNITTGADHCWDFYLEIARQGRMVDVPEARKVLERRAAVPSAGVTHAYLKLFNAFVAQRQKRTDDVYRDASEAIGLFEKLQWHAYADIARTLLPHHEIHKPRNQPSHLPFEELQLLTVRERQVAELALKGLPNRAIARALAIKETTVESHMSSIMGHLGVRSRHQLGDVLSWIPG